MMTRTLPVLSGTVQVREVRYRAWTTIGPALFGASLGWKLGGWLDKKFMVPQFGYGAPKTIRVGLTAVTAVAGMMLITPRLEDWLEGK